MKRSLTVTELTAEEVGTEIAVEAARVAAEQNAEQVVAVVQSTRCAGLKLAGLPEGSNLIDGGDGVYVLHPTLPEYGGFPHYVDSAPMDSCSLYCCDGEWRVGVTYATPIKKSTLESCNEGHASITRRGEVPVGEHGWDCWVNHEWVNRPLTVAELSTAEVVAE